MLASLCRALLVLDVAYCALAVVVPGLPGWKMFEATGRAEYTLIDGRGAAIDAAAWVPRSAAGDLDARDVARVARWLCETGHAPPPLRLDTRRAHLSFSPPACDGDGDR